MQLDSFWQLRCYVLKPDSLTRSSYQPTYRGIVHEQQKAYDSPCSRPYLGNFHI